MIPLHDDNPTTIKPYVTVALIASCTVVFLWQLTLGAGGQRAIYGLGVIPAVLLDNKVLHPSLVMVPAAMTVITSMFLHGGWMHLFGNMLYLWIFGNNVEDTMGHGRFVAFYLLCGIAAVFAQVLPDPDSTIPMIGASGAISGVLGAYFLTYPKASILTLVPIFILFYLIDIPAFIFLGIWFLIQFVSGYASMIAEDGAAGGGIAWWAHVGGFSAGVVLVHFFRQEKLCQSYQRVTKRVRRLTR